MRTALTVLAGFVALACLSGCATRPVSVQTYRSPCRGSAANLALGRTADATRLSEAFAGRATWPSVDAGYRFDDVTYFTEVVYDDQSFYDYQGGGSLHATQSTRTGVVVR